MSVWQVLRIFWARRWLMLGLFVVTAAAGIGYTLSLPKLYAAETALMFDIKPDPLLGSLAPNLASPVYMSTQIEILKSDLIATKVVKELGFERSASAVGQWRDATGGKVPIERFFGGLLQRGLTIEPLRGSSIINVSFASQDPAFASAAANAFAKAYIDMSLDMRVEPARQSAMWFDEQSKVLRSNLERAQTRLADFQREKGIVGERLDQEVTRLSALDAQLTAAKAEQIDVAGRQRSSGSELSPDVLSSGAVQSIKGQIAAAETKLSEISSVVGVNHPQRQQLVVQIAELKQQLNAEIRRVSGGASVLNRSSEQKVAELQTLMEAQKKRVLALRGEQDQIAVLVRDVDTAQRAYEGASQRVGQLNLEGQTTQANVRVLSPAITPLSPSNSREAKGIFGSLFGGLALAALAALAWELIDRRVRSPDDLIAIEGVPVLGVLRPAGSKLPVFRRLAVTGRPGPPALPSMATGVQS